MKTIFYHFKDELYSTHTVTDGYKPDSVHFHTYYEVTFVKSGELTVICNGSAMKVDQPCVVLLRPYTFHEIMAEQGKTFDRYSFYFAKQYAGLFHTDLLDILPLFCSNLTIIPIDEEMAGQLYPLLDTYKSETYYASYRRMLLGLLLEITGRYIGQALDLASMGNVGSMDSKLRYVQEVADYINDNFKEQLTTERIAKYFYISRQKLDNDFKQVMNTTVKQYLLGIRIANAAQMLSSGVSVSEVTEQCGFSNDSHFIRTFRKRFDVSPYQYQKHCGYLVAEQGSAANCLEPMIGGPGSSLIRSNHPIAGGSTFFSQTEFMYRGEPTARKPWCNAFCKAGWTGVTWHAATEDGVKCICVMPVRGKDDVNHILDFNYYQWDNDVYYPSLDCSEYRVLKVRYKLNKAAAETCGESKFYVSPDMKKLSTTLDKKRQAFSSWLSYTMPNKPDVWHTLILDLSQMKVGGMPWEKTTIRQFRYLPFGEREPSPDAVCFIEYIAFYPSLEEAEKKA
ncbi:MAG: helix-turn-helix domain-containing protein [Clostridia bacterium]|nr:helix-turn-helix domain-containing protein [Clostridia bacterium]